MFIVRREHNRQNACLAHFSPFLGLKRLTLEAFWDIQAVKIAQIGLKTGLKYIYSHPKWSGVTLGETHF